MVERVGISLGELQKVINFSARQENCTVWTPLPNLNQDFFILRATSSPDEVKVLLSSESGRKLHVESKGYAAFRIVSSSESELFWNAIEQELMPFGRFWQMEESSWRIESTDSLTLPGSELIHTLIICVDSVVEILSATALHVSWADSFFGDAL